LDTEGRAAGDTLSGDGTGAGQGAGAVAGAVAPAEAAGPAARPGGGPATGIVAGIHPERVVPGAQPGRGLVLTGPLTVVRPSGAGWEAELMVAGHPIICRLPDRPEPDNGRLTVTALGPPLFGPGGTAVGQAEQDGAVGSSCGPGRTSQ
jgi:hypothetical protein